MEQNNLLTKPFKQTFHITDLIYKIIAIPSINKNIPTFNVLHSRKHIKDKSTEIKNSSIILFQKLNKQPPIFSKFYPIYNQERKKLKLLAGYVYNFSVNQLHQYNTKHNKQRRCMSDLEFKPIHKFFRVTISSIKNTKNTNSDIISLHIYKKLPYKITLSLGLLGFCETNATTFPTLEVAYRVNKILKLLDICQSTILDEELSIINIISDNKRNKNYFTKTPYYKATFQISKYTKE